MTDYGHELRFGAFLVPDAAGHEGVLASTTTAEELGLDLVTFQDHPYQPSFLDTWTLLSFLAARTERIGLAPNVANVPLRPPAVLARSAAALDLLSGGRVELGLGSGYFFDAIAAIGGPRRSAGEHVDALSEALTVIRSLWEPGPPVRFEGRHYRLDGVEPGPFPAHPIEIWLGAYQPRMLALTGRAADAWVPTLAYAPPAQLGPMTATLDAAAVEAGREPGEIRRIYNIAGSFGPQRRGFLQGPPELWVEQLAELALEHGVATFLFGPGQDPDGELRRFAEEVAPGVVESVEAARRERPAPEAPTSVGSARPADGRPEPPDGDAAAPGEDAGTPGDGGSGDAPPPDGQAATSAVGRASQEALLGVHEHLREELRRLQGVIGEVAEGRARAETAREYLDAMTMRQNYWTVGAFCASYCRVVAIHHAIEDSRMFPDLRDGDASLGPAIDRLAEQHEAIAGLLEHVDEALVATMADERRLDEAKAAVDQLGEALLDHLAEEEEALLEPIGRLAIRL